MPVLKSLERKKSVFNILRGFSPSDLDEICTMRMDLDFATRLVAVLYCKCGRENGTFFDSR